MRSGIIGKTGARKSALNAEESHVLGYLFYTPKRIERRGAGSATGYRQHT